MNEHTTVSAKQLCTLVFLSLAVDMAVRPFTSGGSAGAQIAILAAVLNTAVVSILLLPVLGLLRREAFTTLKGGVTFGSKALLTLSAVLFAAGGAPASAQNAGAAVRILYRTDVLLRGGFGYESAAAAADHPYAFTSGQHFCIPPSGCSAHCCVDAGGAV